MKTTLSPAPLADDKTATSRIIEFFRQKTFAVVWFLAFVPLLGCARDRQTAPF